MDQNTAIKWRNWIGENAEKGVAENRIREAMKSKGVDYDEVLKATEISPVESGARSVARGVTKGVTGLAEAASGLTPLGMVTNSASTILNLLGKGDQADMLQQAAGMPKAENMNRMIQDQVGEWRRPETTTDRMLERGGRLATEMAVTPGGPLIKGAATALGTGGGEVGRMLGGDTGETVGEIVGSMAADPVNAIRRGYKGVGELKRTGITKPNPSRMPADESEKASQVLKRAMSNVDDPESARRVFTDRDPVRMATEEAANLLVPGTRSVDEAKAVASGKFQKFEAGKPLTMTKKFRDEIAETPRMMAALREVAKNMRDTTAEDLLMAKKWDRSVLEAFRRELSGAANSANNPVPIRKMAQDVPNKGKFPITQQIDAVKAAENVKRLEATQQAIPEMISKRTSLERAKELANNAMGTDLPGPVREQFARNAREKYMPMARTNAAASVQKNMKEGWNPVPAALALAGGMPARFGFEIGSDALTATRMNPKKAQRVVNALANPKDPLWLELQKMPPHRAMLIRGMLAAQGALNDE